MVILSSWIALIAYLAFAIPQWRNVLGRLSRRAGDWSVAIFPVPYLLASAGHPQPITLLAFGVYLTLPTLWLRLRSKAARPLDIFHILTVLSIWVPIEPDLFVLMIDLLTPGIQIRSILPYPLVLLPEVSAPLTSQIDLPIHTLTAILLTLYLFLIHHPLPELGFNFRLRWRDGLQALGGLLAFSLVGIPLGISLDFLRYESNFPGLGTSMLGLLAGYLLVALPEEILFRGLILNLLRSQLKNVNLALFLSAIIFGLAHLNNTTSRFPVPNWAYALIATMAGLAYGWVWLKTKKITSSAVTHALVNFVWGHFFS
jgi:hypothetical protein